MRARSVQRTIAKVELGLAVQGPFDWTDPALDLLNDGLAELHSLTVRYWGCAWGQTFALA